GTSNLTGSVTVNGTARLENVTASGSVIFNGDVNVYGGTYSNTAQILDRAILNGSTVSGNTIFKGNALEWGGTFGGTGVVVGGDAESADCSTAGVYLQFPHPNNGRTDCDGKGATDPSNVDVNSTYSQFTDAQMAWTIIGCGSDTQAPTVPGTPTSSNITNSGVTLSWTASTDNIGVTGYDVLQNGTVVQTVTTTTATITGLAASTTYSFTVKAKDAAGNVSAASGVASVTTLAGAAPVAGTIYKITARHSGKSFCMRGGAGATGNSVQLTQYVYQAGPHQQFKVEANGSYFRLTPQQATDKALDVTGKSTADGANVIQYTWNSASTNQQWSFVSVGNGYYQIKARHSGKCMGVAGSSTADDVNIQQFTCNTSTTSQHFYFEAITGARVATVEPLVENVHELMVYPNPTKNSFTVELKGYDSKDQAVLRIVDLQGKEVLKQDLGEQRKVTYQKSALGMKESIYIIHAQVGKKITTVKLIVNE
ncbi:MAG TPA: RICIN domain-containing protein, partial [Cyclobacteriaceae bacterium]